MPLRIRSILAASDLTEGAREAIRSAGALAALAEAELHVVHVAEPPGAEREAREALRRQVEAALPAGRAPTSERVLPGPVAAGILRRGEEVEADLIVTGAHRPRAGAEASLGTTADRLVRASPRPCLVVREPVVLPLRGIFAPTDLSPAAEIALEVALSWGAALRMPPGSGQRTTLEVLHVVPPGEDGAAAADRLRAQVETAVAREGGRTALTLRQAAEPGDDPAARILERAAGGGVDLVVMATRSAAARGEGVGSVSSTVARGARCPVLLVPPVLWRVRQAEEAARRAV